MQEWKTWKRKMWENTARVENAGLKMQEETAASMESQPHVGPGQPLSPTFPFLSIHFLIFYHFFLFPFIFSYSLSLFTAQRSYASVVLGVVILSVCHTHAL